MEESEKDVLAAAPDSVIRQRFFPTSERKRSSKISYVGSTTRSSPDDPVPANSYTSYKLDEPVKLQMSDKGALAQKPFTVMTELQMTANKYPDSDAFAVKVGGKWQKTKVKDMYQLVRTVAKAFLRLGLKRFHGVGILGFNAPEWIISYLAAIFAGGVAVGIHYNDTVEICQKAALGVPCNIFVVDSAEDLAKILQIRPSLPELYAIVQYGKDKLEKMHGVLSWAELIEMGNKGSEDRLKECILSQAPNYCCSVTFTTGRTGPPKTVMQSHDNLIWTGKVCGKYQSLASSGGAHVSFLPLSQPSGTLLDIILPLLYATTVYFAPRKNFKKKLMDVMREVRPTYLVAIPLFYERIVDRMEVELEKSSFKAAVSRMAMNIGRKAYYKAREGKPRPCGWWLANQLVFKKVQRRLGFDRCPEVHSGKSFLLDSTAEFFISFGILIHNIYGASEMSGPHAFSTPNRHRLGSCGVEMDGCRTKFVSIEKTNHTEVRVKGRHVFMGYLNDPEQTEDAFDEDGWFRTLDMGYRDESGFLWITGSIDELFELADGPKVAPIPIEKEVKNLLPCMGHVIACGHNRPYVSMLFTLQAATDDQTDMPLDVLTKKAELWLRQKNVPISSISQMAASPPEPLVTLVQTVIDQVNSSLHDFSTAIRRWKFLPRDFSFPTGELNLTHSERRGHILQLYAEAIESLYDSP